MSYTHELIKLAKRFDQSLSVDLDPEKHRYSVFINLIAYKEKGAYLRQKIMGYGFTIEDACCDFMRRARGGCVVHSLTDEEIEVI